MPVKQKPGQAIRYIRIEDGALLRMICAERDLNGDATAKQTVHRLLIEAMTRAEMRRERTGEALAAAMRPPTPNGEPE